MRIGVLTTSYPSTPDDPTGHFVRGFAEWLAKHVGDVEVLAFEDDLDPAARFRQGGLPHRLRGVRGAATALAIGARLAAAVLRRAHAWDVIVSHWLVPSGLVGAVVAGRRRHLAIAHGSDLALLAELPGGNAFVRALSRRSDLVYVANALRVAGAPGRVVAMPGFARPIPSRQDGRLALGLDPDDARLIALFVGRWVPEKGAANFLEALPKGVFALVVGDGPERDRLHGHRAVREGRARLLGPQFGRELGHCFAAADVLVVPSTKDGAPTVLHEARTAGLPVIAARVGGIAEVLGKHAWVVDPTVDALRTALRSAEADRAALPRPLPSLGWDEVGPLLWGGARESVNENKIIVVKY